MKDLVPDLIDVDKLFSLSLSLAQPSCCEAGWKEEKRKEKKPVIQEGQRVAEVGRQQKTKAASDCSSPTHISHITITSSLFKKNH